MKKVLLFSVLVLLLAVGCGRTGEIKEESDVIVSDISITNVQKETQEDDLGEAQAEESRGVEYREFIREEYENALSEGKTIFLNFYANWCPICRREKPDIISALRETARDDIAAFQVNYNDFKTDEDEKELARKFQVPYQHTKIIINSKEEELFRTLEVLSKEELKNVLLEV